ncbi:MAG: 2Fe-2S iron-sulfur cluster binding domain-containing protein [Myxococcales bacterium]|nr:2Fe-2S iron-sulfur cluster binding domain-containing protein [Myxococcales bacterium]
MPKVRFLPTFLNAEPVEVEVRPGTTIQQAAYDAQVPIGDACGGNCACSTCHVHVMEGFDDLSEMDDPEDDILGKAEDVQFTSRLGCQAEIGRADVVIRITRESQLAFINEHPEHRGREGEVGV